MSKLEQCVVRYMFFTLKGLRPQQIQTEVSDMYHAQAFQLLAVEKWPLRFTDRTRDLENEPRHGRPMKTDFVGRIASLLFDTPFSSCEAICRRLKIPWTTGLRVLCEELRLTKVYLCWIPHSLDANQVAK
jgi:hypothetical protein